MRDAATGLAQAPDATPLALGPELTIAYAASARAQLLQALDACAGTLVLDLGGVSDFDSSGVQLLLSTRLALQTRGAALQLADASPAVRDALATFGLDALLAEPLAG